MSSLLPVAVLAAGLVGTEPPPPAEQTPTRAVQGRGSVSFNYAITDGGGVGDFLRVELQLGAQLRRAQPGPAPGIGVFATFGPTVAEGLHFTLRPGLGVELSWEARSGIEPYVEMMWGWFKSFSLDEREGVCFRIAPGIRIHIDAGGWLGFEPIGYELLPVPAGAPSPLRARGAIEFSIFQAGGFF